MLPKSQQRDNDNALQFLIPKFLYKHLHIIDSLGNFNVFTGILYIFSYHVYFFQR